MLHIALLVLVLAIMAGALAMVLISSWTDDEPEES